MDPGDLDSGESGQEVDLNEDDVIEVVDEDGEQNGLLSFFVFISLFSL